MTTVMSALVGALLLAAPAPSPSTPAAAHPDDARLQVHFAEVLDELRSAPVDHLDLAQRAARARHIEELARYAADGRYPRNVDFYGQAVPYFVDAGGTHCAVGHLMAADGEGELVERVRQTANHAYVAELQRDPAFQGWLRRAGLSVAEAARIQPAYCFGTHADCICEGKPQGVVEATLLSQADPPAWGATQQLRVDAVHGESALSVGDAFEANAGLPGDEVGDLIVIADHGASNGTGDPIRERVWGQRCDSVICQINNHNAPELSVAEYVQVVTADDCAAAAAAIDPGFAEGVCDAAFPGQISADDPCGGAKTAPPRLADEGGCAGAGAGPVALWLVGLLLLWWARRELVAASVR